MTVQNALRLICIGLGGALLAACDDKVSITGDDGPKLEPCVVVTARIYENWGGVWPNPKRWRGPVEHTVCVISVDGKPYRKAPFGQP